MDCKEFKQKKQTINAYVKMAKLYQANLLNIDYCINCYGKEFVIITMVNGEVYKLNATATSCAEIVSYVSKFLLNK